MWNKNYQLIKKAKKEYYKTAGIKKITDLGGEIMKRFIVFLLIATLLSLSVGAQNISVSNTVEATQTSKNQGSFSLLDFVGNLVGFTVKDSMPTEALITGVCALVLSITAMLGIPVYTVGIFYISGLFSELAFMVQLCLLMLPFSIFSGGAF